MLFISQDFLMFGVGRPVDDTYLFFPGILTEQEKITGHRITKHCCNLSLSSIPHISTLLDPSLAIVQDQTGI